MQVADNVMTQLFRQLFAWPVGMCVAVGAFTDGHFGGLADKAIGRGAGGNRRVRVEAQISSNVRPGFVEWEGLDMEGRGDRRWTHFEGRRGEDKRRGLDERVDRGADGCGVLDGAGVGSDEEGLVAGEATIAPPV